MNQEVLSVTDLNKYIKNKISNDEILNNVIVKGEISNFKHHYTGHMYFTLKDENSLIKCVMFKTDTFNINFNPLDGMKVIIYGKVNVFERDGIYQIYCKDIQEEGIGNLYKQYEELKNRLQKEGYFDNEHKTKIPYMPKIIGVLTSETGSVIKDIINVSSRRNPNVNIRLFPIPVQGQGAKERIVEAIEIMNKKQLADVIILARGGGSLEDLWPFNEEIVAKAIYNSQIPIISAIGHETDFTISDFVSDLRAPTPSAAAELAMPDVYELKIKVDTYKIRMKNSLKKNIKYMKLRFEKAKASKIFKDPLQIIKEQYLNIDMKIKTIENNINNKLNIVKRKSIEQITRLDALSPLKTLTRGYCIAEQNEKVIKSCKSLKKDDIIKLRFVDGEKLTNVI